MKDEGNYQILIKGITKECALEIGNDIWGCLMFLKEEDGVIRAYPSEKIVIEINLRAEMGAV